MTPQELYRAGELGQAIKALGEELRSNPLDTRRRTFLFELLCFAGEYDRAEKQLDVLADQNPKSGPATLLYRSALYAERTRQEMFLRSDTPAPADEDAPITGGALNGKAFQSLSDADPRIGDHLEIFIAGTYTWIPTKYIERLEIEAPKDLRDLLWARARIDCSPKFRLQELGEILLPVLSPLSYLSEDEAVKLGRTNDWDEDADGNERPKGVKFLLVDGVEIPLLEARSIVWGDEGKGPEHSSGDLTDATT